MKSDIILDDKEIEIISDITTISNSNGSYFSISEGTLRLKSKTKVNDIIIQGLGGQTTLSSNLIRTKSVSTDSIRTLSSSASKIDVNVIEIGPEINDSQEVLRHPKFEVKTTKGELLFSIDGNTEQIMIKSIGNLVSKIHALEKEIILLKLKIR